MKLSPPIYPPLARQALVMGDVKLEVSIRPDGTVDSVSQEVSGSPMLRQAAMDSARQSTFECRDCSGANVVFPMTYTFAACNKPDPDSCCCSNGATGAAARAKPTINLSETKNHVTIATGTLCICPDACTIAWAREHSKYRSAKCLYLWKCGDRHIAVE